MIHICLSEKFYINQGNDVYQIFFKPVILSLQYGQDDNKKIVLIQISQAKLCKHGQK